jgi:hypothetical protein
MRFVEIAGANLTLAEGQDEYETIKVRKGVSYVQHGSLLVPQESMTLELKPEPEELERLNAGGSLFLNILGTSWPPVGLTTVDPAIGDPPQGNA